MEGTLGQMSSLCHWDQDSQEISKSTTDTTVKQTVINMIKDHDFSKVLRANL